MTRHPQFIACLSLLLVGCMAGAGLAEAVTQRKAGGAPFKGASSAEVSAISRRGLLMVNRSRSTGAGESCLAGSRFDPERARSIATVVLWDEMAGRPHWARDIPMRSSFQQARAVECIAWNGGYAVLVDSDTQAAASLRQTFSSVYWLGGDGRTRYQLHFDQGRQTWGHALLAMDARLRVYGGAEAADGRLSNTIVEVNSALATINRVTTRNGAYLPGAAVATDARGLLIAGAFLDDAATIQGLPRNAASKINPRTGKYLWSRGMPSDDEVRDAIATIDPMRGAALLGRTPHALRVQWIDLAGRVGVEARFPNRVCHFNDAIQYDGSIYAVGTACDEGGRLYLLRVPHAAAGSPVVLRDFDPRGSLLLQPSGQWQYVSDSPDGPTVEYGHLN